MNRQVEIIRKHTITLNDAECEYLKDLTMCMRKVMDIAYTTQDMDDVIDCLDNMGNMYLNDFIDMFTERCEVK